MKRLILLLILLLPLTSAVTMQKTTQLHESSTGGALIQVWQDTAATSWSANETFGGIVVNDLTTFNSTFINKNTTDISLIRFLSMDAVRVYYSNGTKLTFGGSDFTLTLDIPANENITLATDVPPVSPSTLIFIKPDYVDTVPHIVLGRRLIFTWLSFLF